MKNKHSFIYVDFAKMKKPSPVSVILQTSTLGTDFLWDHCSALCLNLHKIKVFEQKLNPLF